jgi:HAD superfamily hydrolase (TIGR01490 family)
LEFGGVCTVKRTGRITTLAETTGQPISIFDLDRTITRKGTWSPFLVFAASKLAPWRLVLAPAAIVAMLAYKSGAISRRRLKEVMQRIMIGTRVSRERMAGVADAFADRCMATGVYPEAVTLIQSEHTAGRRVMIATAAHHFYLDALARRLGVEDVIGTCSVWRGGELSSRIAGDNCYGEAKREKIEAYVRDQAIRRMHTHIRFYSDHISDLPTFEWADEAIAVNPSPKLARHAAAEGWDIVEWRQNERRRNTPMRASFLPEDAPMSPVSTGL